MPSRRDDSLLLLDFSASEAAGCYALSEDEPEPGFPGGSLSSMASMGGGGSASSGGGFASASQVQQRGQLEAAVVPPAAQLELSQAAICAAAHPTLDLLVAGSLGSCMSLAGLS